MKLPHGKQECSDSENGKNFSDCFTKTKMSCFNCEIERSCESCLDLLS